MGATREMQLAKRPGGDCVCWPPSAERALVPGHPYQAIRPAFPHEKAARP